MRVGILDYGVGNLHSLVKAVCAAGADAHIVADAARSLQYDALILPGVGAFSPAANALSPVRDQLHQAILRGFPALGICLGMQLLFDTSEEGEGQGLGVFEGRVARLQSRSVPQMGWNRLEGPAEPLLARSRLELAYFANSYVCRAEKSEVVTAWSEHEGDRFPSVVRCGRTVGVQFHPEKSSVAGIAFLKAFLEEVRPC